MRSAKPTGQAAAEARAPANEAQDGDMFDEMDFGNFSEEDSVMVTSTTGLLDTGSGSPVGRQAHAEAEAEGQMQPELITGAEAESSQNWANCRII